MSKPIIIPGARKSGTSSLFDLVSSAESISVPEYKETQFFALTEETINTGIGWYIGTRNVEKNKRWIDGSTFYLFDKKAPTKIKRHIGEADIIIIVRDPVERAYSAFWEMKKKVPSVERREFGSIIDKLESKLGSVSEPYTWNDVRTAEDSLLEEEFDKNKVDIGYLDETYLSDKVNAPFRSKFVDRKVPFRYFSNSFYTEFIKKYEEEFENVVTVVMERLINDKGREIRKIENILGISIERNVPRNNTTVIPKNKIAESIIWLKNKWTLLETFWCKVNKYLNEKSYEKLMSFLKTQKPNIGHSDKLRGRKILEQEYNIWCSEKRNTKKVGNNLEDTGP